MLKIDHLTFSYGLKKKSILNDFSLEMPSGRIYGLLGRNGAGKSTLLYLISGLLTPMSGKVLFNGIDTRKRRPETLSDIFIVPEEFSLPDITLKEYVKANACFYPRFSADDLRNNLATFELDPDFNLARLSMGQKKKAFMSFALACNTSLLIMDEPTNGLDIPGKSRFRKFLVSAMDDNRSVIISTHQVRDIDRILDHVIVIDNSKLLLDRSVGDILSRLKFMTTDDRTAIENALYSQPSVGGSNIVVPNLDGEDTELNLECLFELSLRHPEIIQDTFCQQND